MKLALVLVIVGAIGAFVAFVVGANEAFALFPVQNLNSFTVSNQTSGEPIFVIVGEFTNNGPDREDFVDIAATLYDENRRIISVQPFYEDDIKPGDTIPFNLQIPASAVEGGDLAKVADFRVTAE
jgi:hypothetical protein